MPSSPRVSNLVLTFLWSKPSLHIPSFRRNDISTCLHSLTNNGKYWNAEAVFYRQLAMHTWLSRSLSPRKSTNCRLAEPARPKVPAPWDLTNAGRTKMWYRGCTHVCVCTHKKTPLKLLDLWVSSKRRRSVWLSGGAPRSAVAMCDIKQMIAWCPCTPPVNL